VWEFWLVVMVENGRWWFFLHILNWTIDVILMNVDNLKFTQGKPNLASYMLLKKSFVSMQFVSEWLAYAQDSRAITDDANTLGASNHKDFQDHRHDQSILSLLAKKWNLTTYPDPSQSGEGQNRPYLSIFDHHRIRQ
jgi:hypothetical protein